MFESEDAEQALFQPCTMAPDTAACDESYSVFGEDIAPEHAVRFTRPDGSVLCQDAVELYQWLRTNPNASVPILQCALSDEERKRVIARAEQLLPAEERREQEDQFNYFQPTNEELLVMARERRAPNVPVQAGAALAFAEQVRAQRRERELTRTAADRLNDVCMSADVCEEALYDAIIRDDAPVVALLCRGAAPDASYAAPEVQSRLIDVNQPIVRDRANVTAAAADTRERYAVGAERRGNAAQAARLRGLSIEQFIDEQYGERPLQVALYNLSSDAARVLVACGAQPMSIDHGHLADGIADRADDYDDSDARIASLLALLRDAGSVPDFRSLYFNLEKTLLPYADDEFWQRTLDAFRARPEAIVLPREPSALSCATREACDQLLVDTIGRNSGMAIRAMCVAGVLPNLNLPVAFVDDETEEAREGSPLSIAFNSAKARAALALVECGAQQYEGMADEFASLLDRALLIAPTASQVVRVQQDADALVRVLRAVGVPNADRLSARANERILKRAHEFNVRRGGSRGSQAGQSRGVGL